MLKRILRRRKPDIASVAISDLIQQTDQLAKRIKGLETEIKHLKREVQSRTALAQSSLVNLSLDELRSVSRSSAQTAYLGEDLLLCRILGRYLLYASAKDTDLVPHLCLNGFWEPRLTMTLLKTIQPNWYCLDVGANHGYYTLLLADLVGAAGRVLALEPNHKLGNLIQRSLSVNGFADWAAVRSVAAAAESGETVQLIVPAGKTGHASIRIMATADDEVMEVETMTIDQLTADWPRLDVIKIDVEGAEAAVWQGMQYTLQRHPNVLILLEFGVARYPNPKEFLDEIQAAGFNLRQIDQGGEIKPVSIDECLNERQDSYWDLFLSRQ